MRKVPIIVISVLVVLVLFMALCTFVQRPYEDVLLDRFGSIVENPTTLVGNWKLCLPTDKVVRVDKRLHLYNSNLVQMNTAGSEPISIRTFAAWRITNPSMFYKRIGTDESAKSFLDQKVMGQVQLKLAAHKLDEVFNTNATAVKTHRFEEEITREVNDQIAGEGMQVAQIGFSRMAFPPDAARVVYDRMVAERNKQAEQYRAKGKADAAEIRGKGDEEARKIRSQAESDAQNIRGEGDAKAVAILTEAQKAPGAQEFYQYWKSMDVFRNSLKSSTYLVLPSDSPMLELLFSPPGKAGDIKKVQADPKALQPK